MIHIPIFFWIGNKEGKLLEGVIEYAFEDKVIVVLTPNHYILEDSSQRQSCPKDSCKTFVIE